MAWSHAKMVDMGIYSKELRVRAVERGIPRKDVVEAFSRFLPLFTRVGGSNVLPEEGAGLAMGHVKVSANASVKP